MKRVLVVTMVLAVLAIVSGASIAVSTQEYTRAMSAIRSFHLELSDLELRAEGSPEVLVAFRVANDSPVNFELDEFRFSLDLNGQFVGSNYVPYSKGILESFEEATMDFVIPIQPQYQQYLEEAQEKDSFSWFVNGRYKLVLPIREKAIWLDIKSRWDGP
jgi:hypothetical protein